jgi:HEAT repeat protein
MDLAELTLAVHRRDIAAVEAAFDESDPSIRSVALSGLHKLSVLTARHIALALTDTDRSVRHRLAEIGAVDSRVDLLTLLNDEDFAVAETAAWAIGERESVGELELQALISCSAGHPHALVRESCVAALGSIGDPRGLPAILHAYNDKPAVRRRAVLSLAPFSGAEVDAILHSALEDRDWQVRQTAEDLLADSSIAD